MIMTLFTYTFGLMPHTHVIDRMLSCTQDQHLAGPMQDSIVKIEDFWIQKLRPKPPMNSEPHKARAATRMLPCSCVLYNAPLRRQSPLQHKGRRHLRVVGICAYSVLPLFCLQPCRSQQALTHIGVT